MKKLACLLALALLLGCAACSAPAETAADPEQTAAEPAGTETTEAPDEAAETTTPEASEAAAPAEPEDAEAPSALARVLEIVLAKARAGDPYDLWDRAVLTDLNGDGADELLVTYQTADNMEQRLEIWTDEDGAPRLLWEAGLFQAAGGPQGGVKWLEKDGAVYLCVYESNYGSRGSGNFTGSLRCFSPTYWTEDGIYRRHRMSYDFFGSDDRTPDPQAADNWLVFDSTACTVEEFQAWMAAFDQAEEVLLHVGGEDMVGMTLEETAAALGLTAPEG